MFHDTSAFVRSAAAGLAPLDRLAHGVVQAQEQQGAPPPTARLKGGQQLPSQPARPPDGCRKARLRGREPPQAEAEPAASAQPPAENPTPPYGRPPAGCKRPRVRHLVI